jgi:hypothetical protein
LHRPMGVLAVDQAPKRGGQGHRRLHFGEPIHGSSRTPVSSWSNVRFQSSVKRQYMKLTAVFLLQKMSITCL